jgi:hypothetical protein
MSIYACILIGAFLVLAGLTILVCARMDVPGRAMVRKVPADEENDPPD